MRKKLGIFTFLCIILFCFSTIVLADSFKFIPTADKTTLKPGDEVEIKLKISDIDVGSTGINTIEAKLQYDENIFEKVNQDNIDSKNNWSLTYNSEETEQKGKMLAMILSTGVTKEQEIGSIKLKVKSNLTSTTKTKQTEVKIINISTNNGTQILNETDKTIPLTLQFDKVVAEEIQTPTPTPTAGTDSSKDKTTADGTVPQTGTNEVIVLFVIGTLGVIGITTYIRYKKIIIK